MLQTYKAKLNSGTVVWSDDVPDSVRDGKDVDIIVTVMDARQANGRRPFGLARGEFVVPDDFDDPLPDEILVDFEG